jgi:hypothetical protein
MPVDLNNLQALLADVEQWSSNLAAVARYESPEQRRDAYAACLTAAATYLPQLAAAVRELAGSRDTWREQAEFAERTTRQMTAVADGHELPDDEPRDARVDTVRRLAQQLRCPICDGAGVVETGSYPDTNGHLPMGPCACNGSGNIIESYSTLSQQVRELAEENEQLRRNYAPTATAEAIHNFHAGPAIDAIAAKNRAAITTEPTKHEEIGGCSCGARFYEGDDPHAHECVYDEIESLRQRVRELAKDGERLRRYAQHDLDCPQHPMPVLLAGSDTPCSCGLAALDAAMTPPEAKE